ncbi:hypothetical protein ASPBRDRAFT_192922 [Aspergillus brasiliensis CBS 101740]|uniref:Uncharacterized protein n=1 Tax=Aspergillus brasiliensis (strain CBS 101740 / IMI 381727 / IBT 21946) TaxID=767769 RepID=A0A1L9UR72_ASPBC|nr:hypothetical protein ASPBRDRAFT_192922 [Aspergillus brasiliensis CBS 101740]
METAAGVPLAVGKAALQILNKWLENRETAQAWFGTDWEDFVEVRTIRQRFRKVRRQLAGDDLHINYVFTIKEADWKVVIRNCIEECHNWYGQRENGECCWLPIYRSIIKRLEKKKVLELAASSSSTIGTVASLPAAVLESWGLIVMAYANGASGQYIEYNGGYQAIFDANNFILSIKQPSLHSLAVAHITAREHEKKVMNLPSEQWLNLLSQGYSLDAESPLLRWWTKERCKDLIPPPELLNGECDDQLGKTIFDYYFARRLGEAIRVSIFKCIDYWKAAREDSKIVGADAFFETEGEKIITNLKRVKLLVGDGIRDQFCEEMTASDTHHYLTKMLETLKGNLTNYPWLETKMIIAQHGVVLALVKLYVLARKVPERWSTRDTGHTLLLAGGVEVI